MAEVVKRVVIQGRVQGVGYRFSMVEQAQHLALRGWVRNRRDGSVEAVAAGEPAAVEQLIGWARRGPTGARVMQVEVLPADAAELDGEGFEQRPTA